MRSTIVAGFVVYGLASVQPAMAQRFPFERTFDATGASTLDVSTLRGKIDVTAGDPGRIVVAGTVTVRVDWNVPANAADLAKQVAANPPIQQDAQRITLRPPSDPAAQRALTVSYQVRVPSNTRVTTTSDSGATTVREVSGTVSVRTQSGAIELGKLGADAEVTTGSGAVTIDGVAGGLTVKTTSSTISGRSLGGTVHVRTQSGSVETQLSGTGDADIETGSSAIRVSGAKAGVTASSRSGHITITGVPGRPWSADSGSGALDIGIESRAAFTVEATTGSGSVNVEGAQVQGSVTKRRVAGTVGAGGPLVRANSRSGSIHLKVGS
jgi:hypothetical protein